MCRGDLHKYVWLREGRELSLGRSPIGLDPPNIRITEQAMAKMADLGWSSACAARRLLRGAQKPSHPFY